ncbi:hypothetical protein [Euryhalocaulis caribicus]|uniref:hypothetical protein n=1 Tax=Euryhalocaulis caribicus TaxID=1161401 RepID=UPI0003B3ADD7|nr:hypothetical protein [Euryhalocaulis caribicus]
MTYDELDSDYENRVTPDWIDAQLSAHSLTRRDLSRGTGISYRAIVGIFSPTEQRQIRHDEAVAFRRFFKAVAEGRPDDSGDGLRDALGGARRDSAQIPLFGAALTGPISLTPQGRIGTTERAPAQREASRAFAVSVQDDDNAPRYMTGELAYVVGGRAPRAGEDAVVELTDGEAWLGVFDGRSDNAVRLKRGDKVKAFTLDKVRAIHKVVGRG